MFKKMQIKGILIGFGLLTLSLVFTGSSCGSSSTDGGGESGKEGSFVSTDSSTGTISLAVNSTRLGIGDTSGFFVNVKDVNGGPVNALRISCDTENGLALIEPTIGYELTDGFGNMSGVIGCEAPGSFQVACRLPVGGNKRKFETIICTGDVPADFTGFPGAGGGGLGGGVDTTDSQDEDFSVRISAVNLYDDGVTSTTTPGIDSSQNPSCPNGEPEPFFDSQIGFNIVNNSTSIVRIESYTYTVANFDGAGNSYTSDRIFFLGEAQSVDGDGGTTEVIGLFIETNGSGKTYFGRSDTITDLGFKNVTFNLRATNSEGETINIAATVAISVGTFDRC